MSQDNNIHFAAYGAAVPSVSMSVQSRVETVHGFTKSKYGNNMFLAFGSTAAAALRSMADGLDMQGISHIDGVSLNYDAESQVDDDIYCVSAFIREELQETESGP
jgi:hypothetical protein